MARRRRRAQWLIVGLLVAGVATAAAPPSAPANPPRTPAAKTPATSDPPPTPVGKKAQTAPDAALLLYMSEFEDAQGEWIDPADLPPEADAAAEDDDDAS